MPADLSGASMASEAIVRALASADPTYPDDMTGGPACGLCVEFPDRTTSTMALGDHAEDCPWRLAVEWVAAHPDHPEPG